ncbi:MAG: hypothetical protein IPP45_07795 [Sphingomonadales bacterium]|nr:hypothetical protein [Sphingomonadales bacterium]
MDGWASSKTESVGADRLRGRGRGGNFLAIDRATWNRLWEVEIGNRLNFVTAYIVLLAGTGSDHQLSKWSAKACEQHTGMGKPRAKVAIDELIEHGFVARTDSSTKLHPQYRLQPTPLESDPIFLPVALVTGIETEASMLRRVRETGDALLLRMLVDLCGLVQLDATFGVPVSALSQTASKDYPARKVFEIGIHSIWALRLSGGLKSASGDWTVLHRAKSRSMDGAWEDFWARVGVLEKIGAIWYEAWIFDGAEADAEPLFPVDFAALYRRAEGDDVAQLTSTMFDAAANLSEERSDLLGRYSLDMLVTLAQHRRAPGIRGVARMRIEADTPGRRLAYYKRRTQIEIYEAGFRQVALDALRGEYSRPMNTATPQ